MKFQESLTAPNWFWGTSYSLAFACKLAYKDVALFDSVATGSWGFDVCRPFDIGDTQGYVAWNSAVVLVAFRGTDGLNDFLLDFDFLTEDTGNYRVHRGFWRGFGDVREELRSLIGEAAPDGKNVFLTGHSLGGALALLAAAEFSDWLKPDGVYTFGQPAVGDSVFSAHVGEMLRGRTYRFVNEDDVVPMVPPGPVYSHTEELIFFPDENGDGRRSEPGRAGGVLPEEAFDPGRREKLRTALRELERYAELERSAEVDGVRAQRRLPGIREHFIDRYIERIGGELTSETRGTYHREGRFDEFFVFLPDPPEVSLFPRRPAGVETAVAGKEPSEEEASAIAPDDLPFSVHVIWSPECDGGVNPCRAVAGGLFDFLNHIPGHHLDVESGVGIPVFVGHHFDKVRNRVEKLSVPSAQSNECSVIVPLLHVDAILDQEYDDFVRWLTSSEWNVSGAGNLLVVPAWLDSSWYGDEALNLHASKGIAVSSAGMPLDEKKSIVAREVGIEICRFLMDRARRSAQPSTGKVRIYICYARDEQSLGECLADQIRHSFRQDSLDSIFEVRNLVEGDRVRRGDDGGNAMLLAIRTDAFADSAVCQRELLTAKRFGIPILTMNALNESEKRSLAYGGNTFTLAERIIDACEEYCIKAWLKHLHFHHAAPTVFLRRDLDVEPSYLSRHPELVDFSQGPLDGTETTVVLYPDPPLPAVETDLIRRSYPRVRLATSTTLSRETMRRIPSPPLDGMLVALSLSESVGNLADDLDHLGASLIGTEEKGIFNAHLNAAIAYLTLSLVRAGAELGYGGHFGEEGYARMISNLIESHRRTRNTDDQVVLHSYLAAFLWDLFPPENNQVRVRPYRFPPEGDGAEDRVGRALELARMRQAMAEGVREEVRACDARVILGGRSRPSLGEGDREGYTGRLPGQAEEAMRHLLAGKPVYVAGGFYGASGQVAKALCNQLDGLPVESDFDGHEAYVSFRESYDRERPAGDRCPATLDDLWRTFADFGKGFFWGELAEGEMSRWVDNGLTREENLRLFRTVQADEISALVMDGLQAKARERIERGDAPLKIALFNGSITEVLDVEAYGILVLDGARLHGADGALDACTDGAIQRNLESGKHDQIIPVRSKNLIGDYVIFDILTGLDKVVDAAKGSGSPLAEDIRRGIGKIVTKADKHRLSSLALVPSGVNLGLLPSESVTAIVEALIENRETSHLESVAICEKNTEHYQEVVKTARELEKKGAIVVTELPPKIPGQHRSPLFVSLTFQEEGGVPADSGIGNCFELSGFARGPKSPAATKTEKLSVDRERFEEIVDPNRDAYWPEKDAPPVFDEHDRRGAELADLILPASVREEMLLHRGRPWDVLHDIPSSVVPLEFLAIPLPGASGEFFRPALEHGIRRGLFVNDAPILDPYRFHLPLRVLLVANPTGDLRFTEEEAGMIAEQLAEWGDLIEVTSLVGREEAKLDAVRSLLNGRGEGEQSRFDIIHYAGHGYFEPDEPARCGLQFSDGILTADDIEDLSLDQPPALVVFNACEAGVVRDTNAGASLACRILQTGVRGFVSNRWTVGDRSAADFAVTVFGSLANGRTLGRSILEGRKLLFQRRSRDWANYVFYGSSEIRLLEKS